MGDGDVTDGGEGVTDDGEARYVHEPGGETTPPPGERTFGRDGWLLVAGIVVAFLVVPVVIYLNASGVLALPFELAFLALPMVPAVVLAVLAVWVTTTR